MIKFLKEPGFRQLIIKIIIFIGLGILLSLFISTVFRYTPFFKNYLDIPEDFSLSAPNTRVIFLNALLFGVVSFIIVSYKNLIKIPTFKFRKYQIIFMLLAVSMLFLHYLLKFLINQHTEYFLQATVFWGSIKILLTILFVVMLGISVFGLECIKYFLKKYRKGIILFVVLSIAFFFIMLLIQNLWTLFSGVVTKILFYVFSMFFDDVTYRPNTISLTMNGGGGPLLGINNFKAIVGKPCSGIDSFLLFTSLYALIVMLDYKRLKKIPSIVAFTIGIIGMFLINVMRIFLLFIIGAFIDRDFAIGMFHSNIGWILFIIYFFIFWSIASKYLYKNDKKTIKKKI